jgi:hypothetical protein
MVDGELIGDGELLYANTLNEVFPVHIARSAVSVDLSGAAVTLVVLHAERACTLKKATLLYTEASSGDAGVAVKIGKESDDDFFYTGTSEISKSQWYSKNVTLLQTALLAGDTVLFYSAGGKVGTGEVMLVLEYYYEV